MLLVGSVALAQQGLILEPWRKLPLPAAAAVPPVSAMPGSGLGPVRRVVAVTGPASQLSVGVPAAPAGPKWSPPVVELLVDPWARGPVAAPVTRRRWVPASVDIVDPWADEDTGEDAGKMPRVARTATAEPSRPAGARHSTIF